MLLKTMKNLKATKNKWGFFLFLFLINFPLQTFSISKPVSFCSNELTSLECVKEHITLRYPDPEREDLFFFEGQFIHDGKEYSFSTRRPVFTMESCSELMGKVRFITSTEKFCIHGLDHFSDPPYVTLEGFFSSMGKWTYFVNYEEDYNNGEIYIDDFGPICGCLDLEDEEVDSYTFLNIFKGFDFFTPMKTTDYSTKKSVHRFQTKTGKDKGFIDRLFGKVFNFLNAIF